MPLGTKARISLYKNVKAKILVKRKSIFEAKLAMEKAQREEAELQRQLQELEYLGIDLPGSELETEDSQATTEEYVSPYKPPKKVVYSASCSTTEEHIEEEDLQQDAQIIIFPESNANDALSETEEEHYYTADSPMFADDEPAYPMHSPVYTKNGIINDPIIIN